MKRLLGPLVKDLFWYSEFREILAPEVAFVPGVSATGPFLTGTKQVIIQHLEALAYQLLNQPNLHRQQKMLMLSPNWG